MALSGVSITDIRAQDRLTLAVLSVCSRTEARDIGHIVVVKHMDNIGHGGGESLQIGI